MSDGTKEANQRGPSDQEPTLSSGTATLYQTGALEPAQEDRVSKREDATPNDKS